MLLLLLLFVAVVAAAAVVAATLNVGYVDVGANDITCLHPYHFREVFLGERNRNFHDLLKSYSLVLDTSGVD